MKTFTGKITGTGNRCIDGCYRLVIIVDGYGPHKFEIGTAATITVEEGEEDE